MVPMGLPQRGRSLSATYRGVFVACALLVLASLVAPVGREDLSSRGAIVLGSSGPGTVSGLRQGMAPWSSFQSAEPGLEAARAGGVDPEVISGTTWNWAGYVYCPGWNGSGCPRPAPDSEVEGVEGSWTVPAIANTTPGEVQADATWVGIGGAGTSDLIQAGVDGAAGGGPPAYAVFWEMAPATSTNVALSPVPAVHAGDQIFVNIRLLGTTLEGYQNWSFLIRDNSTDSQWNGTEVCGAGCNPSNLSSADWIQESPYLGPYLLQLPAFTSVSLSGARYLNGPGTWTQLTNLTAPILDISLLDPHYSLSVLGLVSPILSPGTFWFEYLVDAEGPAVLGRDPPLASTPLEPGEPLAASLNLSSPDAFSSASPATVLALAVLLENATNVSCFVIPSGFAPLNVSGGNHSYGVEGPICSGLTGGYYATAVTLWYVPLGAEAGGNGSLELFSTGFANGTYLLIGGPEVGRLTVTPASGELDVGETLSFDVVPIDGTPPYDAAWQGLPAGCPAVDLLNITCRPTSAGVATVAVVVTDGVGASVTSRNLTVAVLPDPVVAIVLASGTPLVGDSIVVSSTVSGGLAPFVYNWTGLPSGCGSANATFVCTPSSSGTYHLQLTVRDAAAWESQANATLAVDPAVLGLGLAAFGTIVVLMVALAVAAVIAVRRRKPPSHRRTTPGELPPADSTGVPAEENPLERTPPTTPPV